MGELLIEELAEGGRPLALDKRTTRVIGMNIDGCPPKQDLLELSHIFHELGAEIMLLGDTQ